MSNESNENQETIADITKEMRHVCHNPTLGVKTNREKSLEKFLKDMLLEYVCRIEAAYKRLAIPTPEQWTEIARQGAEIADLKRENDALKREREDGADAAQICGEIGEMIGREAACHQPVTDCHGLGNAAKMREALEDARRFVSASAQRTDRDLLIMDEKRGAYVLTPKETLIKIDAALSAPPRNCDIMDWRTAWAKWRTECHPQKPCGYAEVVSGTEQFMDWYMSEAKGETK